MKKKISAFCDKAIRSSLWMTIFLLPFTKGGVTTFTYVAIVFWLFKKFINIRQEGFRNFFPDTGLNLPIAIFMGVNLLSGLMGLDIFLSAKGLFGKYLKFVVLYFAAAETINTQTKLKILLTAFLASVPFVFMHAGVQYLTTKCFIKGYGTGRLTSYFASANSFGCWLMILIFIAWGFLNLKGKPGMPNTIKKIALTLILPIGLFFLALTYSRGSILGLVAGSCLAFVLLTIKLNASGKIKAYSLAAFCLIAAFLVCPPALKERIKLIVTENESSLGRLDLWGEALSIAEDFPVLGIGLNTYSATAPKYKRGDGGGIYPHNSFLQMLAETGIIGLAAFLLLLTYFFWTTVKRFMEENSFLVLGLACGVLGLLVQSFFDTHLYSLPFATIFWLMMGLTNSFTKAQN
jgi:O-antigen ligase